ncbi:MAG: hypothetical protein PVI69_05760 [Desulfobacterales bacterium]|jgi:hypothetical protein
MEVSFHLMVVCVEEVQLLEAFGKRLSPKTPCAAEFRAWSRFAALTVKRIKVAPMVVTSAANKQSAVGNEIRRCKQELRSGGDTGEWLEMQLSLRQFDCQKRRVP